MKVTAFALGTSLWAYVNGKLHLIGSPASVRPEIGPTYAYIDGVSVYIPKMRLVR
jgi:hypothetical protein